MEKKALSILLKIVQNNSELSPLRKLGYYYSQIPILLSEAVKDGYLEHAGYFFKLSAEGVAFLSDYSDSENEHGIERWVLPQTNKTVTPCEKYDIIIPDKI
jgi:hypothetical protein